MDRYNAIILTAAQNINKQANLLLQTRTILLQIKKKIICNEYVRIRYDIPTERS